MRTFAVNTAAVDDLGGQELRHRREMAGYLDRDEFARLVGISTRTLEGWESSRGRVPDGKLALVEEVLHRHRGGDLADLSDAELVSQMQRILAEINLRLAQVDPKRSGGFPHDRPDAGATSPSIQTDPESSLTVHPKRPTRQAGKRPPRPTPPGPTSK